MFLDRKSHGSGLWITGPRLSLDPWWTHDHGAVRPIRGSGGHRDSSEREREWRSLGFLPMTSLGGEAVEMATRWRSTEAVGGAPIGRWFRVQGGEIGAGVGALDNGGALIASFIGL
jgi:hypothetical protein